MVIASDCFTILKTKTVQFISLDLVSKSRTRILSEYDIKTVQEMYGAAKHVIVRTSFNSNKAIIMIKNRTWEAVKYYGKCYTFFIYNNGRVWENTKINVIDN